MFLFQLLKPLEVHRDGELTIDSDVLRLSDEDTYFDRLTLRLSKAPKHGNLFEIMQQSLLGTSTTDVGSPNATTVSSMNRKRIAEGEEVPASLISEGRLRYGYYLIVFKHCI